MGALTCQHLTEKKFGFKLHPRPLSLPRQGIKMMFNGLPVLSAVLVCSTVFFGYVAPNTVPEVGDECENVLHEVESVKTCIRDVIYYLELADESCSDSLVDWLDVIENVKTCLRDVDFYLELADKSCSDSLVGWATHVYIIEAINERACQ